MTPTTDRLLRRISPRSRAGGVVLVCALLAGVLAATVGAGYSISRPLLDNGGTYVAKGQTVAYVNAESRKIESEARTLASGDSPIEVVTLSDGRAALVDKKANKVWLIERGTMVPQGPPIEQPDPAGPPPGTDITVVPAPDGGYLAVGDLITRIGPDGQRGAPVRLSARIAGQIVPDAVEGIWVLTDDGRVAHVAGDAVRRHVSTDRPVKHLTVADGRPVGLSDAGDLLDLSAQPLRRITGEQVPHGDVVVGSAKGAGRWVLVLDRATGRLVAVDIRTGTVNAAEVPSEPEHKLGAPVQAGDRLYVPDFAKHRLYVRKVGSDHALPDIEVPGEAPTFSLEVRAGRVWANDQFDRRAVAITDDGTPALVDKGDGPGVKTDTSKPPSNEPDDKPGETPVPHPTDTQPPPAPQPAPLVEVPVVPAGTRTDVACGLVKAADLKCALAAAGTDGPADTVVEDNPTTPPAGTQVPKGSTVTVRYYGPTTVPGVIGQYTDNACTLINNAKLTCVRRPRDGVAPLPEDLDKVKDQSPRAGGKIPTGGDVTISYYDKAPMSDYTGQEGREACQAVTGTYHTVSCNSIPGMTASAYYQEHGQALEPGTVYAQNPPVGGPVHIGDSVTLTVIQSSQVPNVVGQTPEIACQTLTDMGYRCDPRPDAFARGRVVVSQDPPAATDMKLGGTVIIHYSPYAPELTPFMCRRSNGDFVFRMLQTCSAPYGGEKWSIGSGYRAEQVEPNTIPLYEHYCTGGNPNAGNRCLGFTENRYYSRGANVDPNGWAVQPAQVRVVSDCPRNADGTDANPSDGLQPIYQVLYFENNQTVRKYTVRTGNNLAFPGLGPLSYVEFLGCTWQ